MNENQSDRVPIREIMQRLDLGRIAVYRALDARQIPGLRIGNRWVVSRLAFQRWLETAGMEQRQNVQ